MTYLGLVLAVIVLFAVLLLRRLGYRLIAVLVLFVAGGLLIADFFFMSQTLGRWGALGAGFLTWGVIDLWQMRK